MTSIDCSGRVDHIVDNHGTDGYTGCANHGAAFGSLTWRTRLARAD